MADTQDVTATVHAGGVTIEPTDLTVETMRSDEEAGLCTVTGVADVVPSTDSTLTVDLLGDRVFTGHIASATETDGPLVKARAFDARRRLQHATLTQTFTQATIGQVATAALDAAGVNGTVSLPALRTSAEFTSARCDRILTKAARYGNGVWYVDAENHVHVTTSPPSQAHRLRWVLDSSPGKQTPSYQAVQVFGSSPASTHGLGAMCLLSSEEVSATAGAGTPVYQYQDSNIRTQKMAENTAQAILAEFEKQQAGGWIDVVGDTRPWPLDIVELPEGLGGERYLVSGIRHRLTNTDGYRTRVMCGGLTSTD